MDAKELCNKYTAGATQENPEGKIVIYRGMDEYKNEDIYQLCRCFEAGETIIDVHIDRKGTRWSWEASRPRADCFVVREPFAATLIATWPQKYSGDYHILNKAELKQVFINTRDKMEKVAA